MNTYIIGEANMIHVKGEYYNDKPLICGNCGEKDEYLKDKPLIRCSNCGERGISEFDRHCKGCGYLLHRVDDRFDGINISHIPPIIEVDELPKVLQIIDNAKWMNKVLQGQSNIEADTPSCDTCKYQSAQFNPCNGCNDKSEYMPMADKDGD